MPPIQICSGYVANTGLKCTKKTQGVYCKFHDPNHDRSKRKTDRSKHKNDNSVVEDACEEQDICSICCETMIEKTCTFLPCLHKYHEDCFKKWSNMGHATSCPTCRHDYVNIYNVVTAVYKKPPIVNNVASLPEEKKDEYNSTEKTLERFSIEYDILYLKISDENEKHHKLIEELEKQLYSKQRCIDILLRNRQ
jgi:hypothetical protein